MKPGPSMLALVADAFGGRGGIAQYNRDLLSAMVGSQSISSILCLPRHAPDPFRAPAGIVQMVSRPGRLAYSATAVWAALRHRADIVFCGHLFMAPLAALIARLTKAKLIVQVHGIEAWARPSTLCRTAVEAADMVLCVSRFTRARVLDWASIAPERVIVLSNTVDARFSPGDASALREAWGLSGKRVLLTVGRIDVSERYKGHEKVMAAIPQLVSRGHDVVFVVLGGGNDRLRLEAVANELGVADRVQFKGRTSPETLLEAYRMADLFVMPSVGEGFGIVYLEAMASGTPAMGLGVAGALDSLAEGELGLAVGNADLADELIRALTKPLPDPYALANATRARFGNAVFSFAARAALIRLREAA